jgi:uncharacterized membrane protein YbhN (UPF0104 family)
MRASYRRALALLGSLVLLGIVAWRVDLAAAANMLRSARPGPLLLAAALGPVQIVLSAQRWRLVTAALDARPPTLWAASEEYAASTLLNQLLPGGVSGDVLRAWRQHRRWDIPGGVAARTVVLERAAGQGVLLAVVLSGLLAWPMLHDGVIRPPGLLPLVGVLSLVAGILTVTPAAAPIRRGAVLGLSAVITASYIVAFVLCAAALGLSAGGAALTAIPLVLLAMALPISVGGWGLREAAAAALLPLLGWTPEAAVATSALYGLSALLGAAPGALVLLRVPTASA